MIIRKNSLSFLMKSKRIQVIDVLVILKTINLLRKGLSSTERTHSSTENTFIRYPKK